VTDFALRKPEEARAVRQFALVEENPFPAEHAQLAGDFSAPGMAGKAADGEVGADDAVAGHLRREGIFPERLAHGPRAADAEMPGEFPVRGDPPPRNPLRRATPFQERVYAAARSHFTFCTLM
jgi:hypothetical protein